MVKFKYLLKAIDNDIKSHQHLRLPKPVSKTFNWFHNKFCNDKIQDKEMGVITNGNGKIGLFLKGDYDSITLDWDRIKEAYLENGELHLTHNHPREEIYTVAECLSDGDVAQLFRTVRVDGEDMFALKSISCESANGSRMTLTRGDHFKMENYADVMDLQKEMWDYWQNYREEYYNYKLALPKRFNDFDSYEDWQDYAHKEAIREIGRFEQTPEFKKLQKRFRALDCKLTYTYPFDYRIHG